MRTRQLGDSLRHRVLADVRAANIYRYGIDDDSLWLCLEANWGLHVREHVERTVQGGAT